MSLSLSRLSRLYRYWVLTMVVFALVAGGCSSVGDGDVDGELVEAPSPAVQASKPSMPEPPMARTVAADHPQGAASVPGLRVGQPAHLIIVVSMIVGVLAFVVGVLLGTQARRAAIDGE